MPAFRTAIEFLPATPLEYLERWIAANDVFGDNVTLAAVLEWEDGLTSFMIAQPQYHGQPAPEREIESFFEASGWKWLPDASGHRLYFNYAFQVLAINALPRNCYAYDGLLLDVGTKTFGTIDRKKVTAAGFSGFIPPALADAAQYEKLRQFAHDPAWNARGNYGDHIGPLDPTFAETVLAPLISGPLPVGE